VSVDKPTIPLERVSLIVGAGLSRHHEALLGVLEGPPSIPGGNDVKCPICGDHSPPAWRAFKTEPSAAHGYVDALPGAKSILEDVILDWMRCSNEECEELIVRVHEQRLTGTVSPLLRTDTWIVRPRFGDTERPIHAIVPEPFRTDYAEAAAILSLSPRMSAVLSRRILADLLESYAELTEFSLTARIDKFAADAAHPRQLRENLHHFREVADFGAHTQKDDQAAVINVGREEAEWTLDLLDRLFDYFIATPAKDQKIREAMDERIKGAGRKPIQPLPADPPDSPQI
jgi:hypothetical protein